MSITHRYNQIKETRRTEGHYFVCPSEESTDATQLDIISLFVLKNDGDGIGNYFELYHVYQLIFLYKMN